MVPIRVSAAHLEASSRVLLESATVGGVSLLIPHKPAGAAIVDRCSPAAIVANAVNAVRRAPDGLLERELFDGEGFQALTRSRGDRLRESTRASDRRRRRGFSACHDVGCGKRSGNWPV
jgi:shikimate 5-dehydrogenase